MERIGTEMGQDTSALGGAGGAGGGDGGGAGGAPGSGEGEGSASDAAGDASARSTQNARGFAASGVEEQHGRGRRRNG
jgi:hypothetical protein